MKWRRLLVLALTVAASSGLSLLATHWGAMSGWSEALELRSLDWRQIAASESAKDSEVVLVLFDSAATRDWPYLSPYPRAFIADVIDAVAGAGAHVIGLDVYVDRLYPELNRMDGGDDRLRDAIARAGNVVLAAPTEVTDSGPRLASPHPFFADVALDVAAADLPTPFETVRDGLVAVRSRDGLEPSLALALYAHAAGLTLDSLLQAALEKRAFEIPGLPSEFERLDPTWFREGVEPRGY
ncbi:MAG: CHASE2 domain-containing protein, partial [Gemmatimonadetes bacterium]|nr:CHASE2 domain-containing protein [Gemmatimonadota bacterium]